MDQLFLTVRGVVQGSFMATLGVASVFVHVVLRPGWRAWRCSPTTTTTTSGFFFGVNLDYLDFSGGIFDLFYEPVREKTNNLGSDQVWHKPACTVSEDGKRLEILDLESRGIVLSM